MSPFPAGSVTDSTTQWPFRGAAFHLDSRSALVKSMERAAKQQELSDGYRALFGELPTSTYTQFDFQKLFTTPTFLKNLT